MVSEFESQARRYLLYADYDVMKREEICMIRAYANKGYEAYIIPVKNEENLKKFEHIKSAVWVYAKDGKSHGRLPALVLPGLVDIWGMENLQKAGYKKYFLVFKDVESGNFYFGNYTSFSKSHWADERKIASEMTQVDIDELEKL